MISKCNKSHLKISVSNSRLPIRPIHLWMQMHDPWGSRQGEDHHLLMRQCLGIEVIIQWPQLVVSRDQPQLCARVGGGDIRAHVAEDVFVVEHDRAVDFGLSGPGGFVPGKEDLDSDVFAVPCATPHFTVTTFSCKIFLGSISEMNCSNFFKQFWVFMK